MAGIYIHIPFCKQRCTYCDFHFSTDSTYSQRMIDCMAQELALRKEEVRNEPLETIYFGGGTPSIIDIPTVTKIFKVLRQHYDLSHLREVTLEANPDDITAEKVVAWEKLGINRLSIGVQSFDDFDLKWMNRAHSASQSLESIQIAQDNGISNLTIDLIYGLPEMSLERWRQQIQRALSLNVQHISAYCLTVEEKTALAQKVKNGELTPAAPSLQNQQADLLEEILEKHGFIHYEISNFGLPNFIAQHNSNYWKGVPYLGIGPSAHSFDGQQRKWNVANNFSYMKAIEQAKLPLEVEVLTSENRFNEKILIGLRTIWGVKVQELAEILPLDADFYRKVENYRKKNWLTFENERLVLTREGKHWADAIAGDFFKV